MKGGRWGNIYLKRRGRGRSEKRERKAGGGRESDVGLWDSMFNHPAH